MLLEMAIADAADFFHTFGTVEALQEYFGLRPVSVDAVAQYGIAVISAAVDSAGRTHPRLGTVPMSFVAAPAIAQGVHESVLYGAEGGGSLEAGALAPARLSSRIQPELDSPRSREPHVIVIDDILCLAGSPRLSGRAAWLAFEVVRASR